MAVHVGGRPPLRPGGVHGHRRRSGHHRPDRFGLGRHVHRAPLHRTVDPTGPRVRGRIRHVHRGRVRPRGPTPHGGLRHLDRGPGHGGRHHPEQRPREPRGGLLRAGALRPGGHPGEPDDRRPLPSAGLRHDLRGRLRPGPGPGRVGRGRAQAAGVRPRRGHRPLRARLPGPPGLRPRRPTGAGPDQRLGGAAGGPPCLRHQRAHPRRRRRVRVLRPVQLRDHPPVRGLRLLRRRRGRRLRHGRHDRPRRPVPDDHRRGTDVVQPRRGAGPAAPTGHPGGPTGEGRVHHRPGAGGRGGHVLGWRARVRCSPTCCSWERSARDLARTPAGGHPGPTRHAGLPPVLGGYRPARAALPTVRRVPGHHPHAGHGVRPLWLARR